MHKILDFVAIASLMWQYQERAKSSKKRSKTLLCDKVSRLKWKTLRKESSSSASVWELELWEQFQKALRNIWQTWDLTKSKWPNSKRQHCWYSTHSAPMPQRFPGSLGEIKLNKFQNHWSKSNGWLRGSWW